MKRGGRPRRKKSKAGLRKAQLRLRAHITEGASELRSANEGLRREIQRRKGLEGEILEIGDREQQRLGQELHDGLCQHLTAVAFIARGRIPKIWPKARRSTSSSRHHTHATCERAAEQITISPLTERIYVIRTTALLF